MRISSSIAIVGLVILLSGTKVTAQSPPTPRDTSIKGPQTFAIIMGISKYKYVRPLSYADKDAEMFRDYLRSPAGGSISDNNIFILLNEQALSTNFWSKGFKWLDAKKMQKGDRLFIYLAGHGDAIDEDQFFYLTYDCNPAGDKNNYIAGGNVQLYNLKKKIAKETAKGAEVFFIMDACRTSELPGGAEGQNFLNSAISETRAGEIIMLATGAGQESLEDASIGSGHGLFTYYLVDGLNGLADTEGTPDNKVTLAEIQKYVDKNVPAVAQQRFRRKQDPFFCCNENSEKIVSIVDEEHLKKWMETRKKGPGSSFNGSIRNKRIHSSIADTQLLQTYYLFNDAVKQNKLTGKESAEFYYNQLEEKFPGNSYTTDAQSTLAVEFINFAQAKINLYLDCKDAVAIQRIRAQLDDEGNADEITASIDRMEKVAQQEFYEVGNMLEKAINIIRPDDPDFAETLTGRMYFFKARGYFGKAKKVIDINKAFDYAYSALAKDKKAAYILNTISSLHLDNYRYDSAIFYAKEAIITAPKWRYPYVTLAFAYRTLSKPDSAIKYYNKSIEADPKNADAYVDLGHYYFSLSKGDSAIAYYEKALQIEPGNVYAGNNIGWLYFNRKKYDEAIRYFKSSITLDPKLINAYNGLSKSFFEKKEYDSARIYYSRAFANYQDKSIVNVYIGNFYRDLKAYDSAKVYYRLAASLDPNYEDAFNNLGRSSFALKQYDSARYFYRQALQANPYSAFALINMGIVFKELKQADSTYNYFQQAIRLEPKNPSILNNLGVIYGEDKSYDSAKRYFRRALLVRPDYKPASNNLMKVFRELNELDSVTNFLKSSSLFDPGSSSFLNDMGLVFYDQKRYDSARFYIRKAIVQDPANPRLLNSMGLVLQGMKQYDSARAYLQKAIKVDPENPVLLMNLAGVFKQLKNSDSAAHYFRQQLILRSQSDIPQTYLAIGNFFADMKLNDSAVIYFKKAIALNDNYQPGYINAGVSYMEMEENDSALVYLRRAVEINPLNAVATLNLGLIYHVRANYDSAIVYLQQAIRLDPGKGKTYYQLACSYALSNKPEQAIQYLRQAYEKGYKNTEGLLIDPDLFGLKNYVEFQALLDKYVPDWRKR